MFRFFNRNTFAAYATIPLILILMRIRLFSATNVISVGDETSAPLWNLLISIIKTHRIASASIATVLSLLAAFAVNRITNAHKFTERQSNLGGLFYIIFSSGMLMSQQLHPVLVFIPLCIICIERMFAAAIQPIPTRQCYEAGMCFAIGVLFWGKGIWLLPLVFAMLILLRICNIRTAASFILGVLTPALLAVVWSVWQNRLTELSATMWQNIITPVAFYKTKLLARTYLTCMILLAIVALLRAMRNINSLKIIDRKYMRTIIWFLFYTTGLIMLPYFSFEMLPFVAIFLSILTAAMLQYWKKAVWQESITVGFTALSLLTQWFA